MRRFLPLLVILPLVFACSGDRKAPVSAPPPGGNSDSPLVRQDAGSPTGGGAVQPSAATVRNSPPEIRSVRFVPGDGRPGNTLGVEAEGSDADGDAVQFEIAWSRNGESAGTGNRLTAPVKRGDKVIVTITPIDGKSRGKSATLSREILNTPPA